MSNCFDHKTTFLDTHRKIPLDSHICASRPSVWTRSQAQERSFKKEDIILCFTACELRNLFVTSILEVVYLYKIYVEEKEEEEKEDDEEEWEEGEEEEEAPYSAAGISLCPNRAGYNIGGY